MKKQKFGRVGGLSEVTCPVINTTKTGTPVSLTPKEPHPGPLERLHPTNPENTLGLSEHTVQRQRV